MAYTDEVTAYAQYLAAAPYAREHLDAEQFAIFEADLKKARAAVEVAWLERGAREALTADGNAEPPLPHPGPKDPIIGWTTSDDGEW